MSDASSGAARADILQRILDRKHEEVAERRARVPLDALERGALVTDLVYTPLRTQFLIEAEAAGATIVDGLGMLLHQAAPGFERWFGRRPEVDDATRQAVLSA